MSGYIHEAPGWPGFQWSYERIAGKLAAVSRRQGRLIGRMASLTAELRFEASLQSLTEDVLKSGEIEGEILDRDAVRSSIAEHFGRPTSSKLAGDHSLVGPVKLVLDATQRFDEPLTEMRLFGWHRDLFPVARGDLGAMVVGAWRDDRQGRMQVVSGPLGRETVHYVTPSANRLDRETSDFLEWFEKATLDPVLKAALAHLWFVTLYPFEDGNGRIARAIADMALARSEQSAQRFYSMSAQIRAERKAYYEVLGATQRNGLDITGWLDWFLGCLDRAIRNAEDALAPMFERARFWERYAGVPFNARQRLMLNRLLKGLEVKVTSSSWANLSRTSQDSAARDIDDLIRREILTKDAAGGRSTSYSLALDAPNP